MSEQKKVFDCSYANTESIVQDWAKGNLNGLGIVIESHTLFGDDHLCVRLYSTGNKDIRIAHFWNLTIFDNDGELEVSIRNILDDMKARVSAAAVVNAIKLAGENGRT